MPILFPRHRVDPLPLPNAVTDLSRRHSIRMPLGISSSVSAAVCEQGSCEAKVQVKKTVRRRTRRKHNSVKLPEDEDSPSCSPNCLEPRRKHHKCRWRFEMRRAVDKTSVSMRMEDTEHGSAKFSLDPSKRFSVFVDFRRLLAPAPFKDAGRGCRLSRLVHFLHPNRELANDHHRSSLQIRHEFEYKWKERFVNSLHAIEMFRHVFELRVRNNPLRFTPRIQVPLWVGGEAAPCLAWVREPGSGPGELRFSWKPFTISYDFPQRKIGMNHVGSNGSVSKVGIQARSCQFEHTIAQLCNGALLTITSVLSNNADAISVSAGVNGSWGEILAFGRPNGAFSLSMDTRFYASRRRKLRAVLESENLNALALRLGYFY
ncbi:hypothetical protein BWQ96_02507 [Gracilariopsis chorda]|uniref:Uncharacterized protein n=1 Tax=Gracilariopsis chorda TaxID=448386 RepID=A0A2V3J0H2_9FLOR|nr:hypothetical protein BWQ96_02507 [Gracilariopsis chorda]|eukprot:PXF47825.1 hypothetical protein BWQ96_02507 [Gracilariopsis chorda]